MRTFRIGNCLQSSMGMRRMCCSLKGEEGGLHLQLTYGVVNKCRFTLSYVIG